MFDLKEHISRNILVWKLYKATKHACINAGATGLLRKAGLNKCTLCLKEVMIMVSGFRKSSLHSRAALQDNLSWTDEMFSLWTPKVLVVIVSLNFKQAFRDLEARTLSSLKIRVCTLFYRKLVGRNGEQILYVDDVTKTLFLASLVVLVPQGLVLCGIRAVQPRWNTSLSVLVMSPCPVRVPAKIQIVPELRCFFSFEDAEVGFWLDSSYVHLGLCRLPSDPKLLCPS